MMMDLLLKSIAICAIGLAAGGLWPRASAAERYGVWTCTLVALLFLPLLSTLLPQWEFPFSLPVSEWRGESGKETAGGSARVLVAPGSGEASGSARSEANPVSGSSLPRLHHALFTVWAIGTVTLLGRWLLGVRRGRNLVGRAEPVRDPRVRRLARAAGREVGIHRPVRLRYSGEIAVPMTAGIVEPVVLVPDEAAGWSAGRLRVVLLHELGHVRRRDVAGRALSALALAVYWFHPGVWLLARVSDRARERACDDLVLVGGTVPPETYADHLLAIARGAVTRPRPAPGLALVERSSRLRERIEGILDPRRARRPMAGGRATAAVAAVTFLAVGVAAAGPPRATPSWTEEAPRPAGSFLATREEVLGLPDDTVVSSASDPIASEEVPTEERFAASPVADPAPADTLPTRIRRSLEEGASAAWGSMSVESPAEIERKEYVLRKWMEGGSGAIADRLRELLGRPGGDFYLHLRGGRVDRVVLRPVAGPRVHLEIDAERGITGSLSGTWDPAAGAVNLFWLWGVEQETLEVQVPRGVGAVTIVVGSREVVLARPFEGTGIVRVDLR